MNYTGMTPKGENADPREALYEKIAEAAAKESEKRTLMAKASVVKKDIVGRRIPKDRTPEEKAVSLCRHQRTRRVPKPDTLEV